MSRSGGVAKKRLCVKCGGTATEAVKRGTYREIVSTATRVERGRTYPVERLACGHEWVSTLFR